MTGKFHFLAILLLLYLTSAAQITVDQNDFASAGATVYLSNGQNNPFLNVSNTGPNATWDFSNLRSTGQRQIDYLDVASTNGVYAFYYADIFFNPNRANIALDGTDIPFSQALGVTNPFTFYYKNSSMYKKVGYGGEVAGLPIPIALTPPDTIYRFPMNFGDSHSTGSGYSVSLPSVLTSYYIQQRITTIDGWGTLITPYGTFSVLRSKSEIFGSDSVYVDSLGFGVNIPRSKVTEYKWIAKNEDVPVLQINTSAIFGVEIINLILFKDDKLSITVDSINGTLCPGSNISVHYTATGTFNPGAFLQQANKFTVQLSNSSGIFAGSSNIGNVTSTSSGTISATIPNNATGGTGYRLRVISNSPADTSAVFGPFTINPNPTASITANGSTVICLDDSVELITANGIGFQFQWRFNGADIPGATARNYFARAAGDFTVRVSNVCGSVTSQPATVTISPDPVHAVTPSSLSSCDGSSILITAVNTSGLSPVTYQWYDSVNAISGATDSTYLATASGNYLLVVTSAVGCTFVSDTAAIIIDSMDTPLIYADGNTTFCPGETVMLSTDSNTGFNYQWQLDGADISGANAYFLPVDVGGNYAVLVSDSCDAAISAVQTVIITPLPVHSIAASSSLDCLGSPVTINATNLSVASPVTYQWYENGNLISGATNASLTIDSPGYYSLAATDGFGCSFMSDSLLIEIDTMVAPVIYADGNTAFCPGGSVTLRTDSNANFSYQWRLNGADISGANAHYYSASASGNYTVLVSDTCGSATSQAQSVVASSLPVHSIEASSGLSCIGNPVTIVSANLSGASPVSYQWFENGNMIPGATNSSLVITAPGYYSLAATDGFGCSFRSDSLVIQLDSLAAPLIYISGNPIICPGGSVTLRTDSNGSYSYQWQVDGVDIPGADAYFYNAAADGDYTVYVSDSCGVATSQIQTVWISPLPVQLVTSSSNISCDGSPVAITAANASGVPVVYQWYENGNMVSGATDSFLIVAIPGSYSLAATDGLGCTFNSPPQAIVFDSIAVPELYASGSSSFCEDESVTLWTDTNFLYSYQWLRDGSNISGADEYSYLVTGGGNYSVVVALASGCSDTSLAEKVNVYPKPDVPFITQKDDTLFSSPAETYQWYFNETLIAGAASQSFLPMEDGSYTVEITDATGCANISEAFAFSGTGADDAGRDFAVGVYPNPVAGSDFLVRCAAQFFEIRIFNTAGALMIKHEAEVSTHELIINCSGMPRGVYFVKVRTATGEGVVKLVRM